MKEHQPFDLTRLQEAFSTDAWNEVSQDCPDREILWSSATEDLDPITGETVLLHLARCAQCSSIWRMAREMTAEQALIQTPVVRIGVFKGLTARLRSPALAIAAVALVGIGLGATVFFNRAKPLTPVYREQHRVGWITASPMTSELPRSACRLQWSSDLGDPEYDLLVTDENLEVLFSVKGLLEPEYLLPGDQLPPGTREIFWRVTAHLPDRTTVSSKTFTTKIAGYFAPQ